jgi:hypothetical protein
MRNKAMLKLLEGIVSPDHERQVAFIQRYKYKGNDDLGINDINYNQNYIFFK